MNDTSARVAPVLILPTVPTPLLYRMYTLYLVYLLYQLHLCFVSLSGVIAGLTAEVAVLKGKLRDASSAPERDEATEIKHERLAAAVAVEQEDLRVALQAAQAEQDQCREALQAAKAEQEQQREALLAAQADRDDVAEALQVCDW